MNKTILLPGYNDLQYDITNDVIIGGIYKNRIIKRSPDGVFRVKKKGSLVEVPENEINQAISNRKKIDNPNNRAESYQEKKKYYASNSESHRRDAAKRSDELFRSKHGFHRSGFTNWLKKAYSQLKVPYEQLKHIPESHREYYFDMYREHRGIECVDQ